MSCRFSILIPVYNRAELLRETIASVLAQTFTDFEMIMVDDGSKDHAFEVMRSYADPRIRVRQQANQGPEAARYHAFATATGEYCVLLDNDDLLTPTALATYDRIIRTRNAPPVIIGAMAEYRTGAPLPADNGADGIAEIIEYENLLRRDRPGATTCSQIVAKRSVIAAAGALRQSAIAFPFETADILLLLSGHGPWVTVLRPTTICYRLHDSNTIGNLPFMVRTVPRLIQLEKQGSYPGGSAGRFARRAFIGGVAWNWCSHALKARQFGGAFGLILRSAPMIARGLLRKITQKFRPMYQPIRLAN